MRLEAGAVAGWFGELTASAPPPDLLVVAAPDLVDRALDFVHEMPTLEVRDPGCYLFFLDPLSSTVDDRGDDRVDAQTLAAFARRITISANESRRRIVVDWDLDNDLDTYDSGDDDRDEGSLGELQASPVAEDSFVLLRDGRSVPSVGPGGRVTLEARGTLITGTSSVRPFVQADQPASWVAFDAVLDELAPFLGIEAELTPRFGYYEYPWTDRQTVIRPTFVLVLESSDATQYRSKWVLTVPATLPTGDDSRRR